MVLNSIASFSCLGSSNLYSNYLFFVSKKSTIRFQDKKTSSYYSWKLRISTYPVTKSHCQSNYPDKNTQMRCFPWFTVRFSGKFLPFFMNKATRVHFWAKTWEKSKKRSTSSGSAGVETAESELLPSDQSMSCRVTRVEGPYSWLRSKVRSELIICQQHREQWASNEPAMSQQKAHEFFSGFVISLASKIFAKQGKRMATYCQHFKGQGS